MLSEMMTTNYYKILALLYDKSEIVNKKRVATLTQNEIAFSSGLSSVTISRIMKELQNNKLIDYQTNVFAQYYITNKGIEVVEKIRSIDN